MGKYSGFERIKNDYYVTPERGMLPLIHEIPFGASYYDPCYGSGAIPIHLNKLRPDMVLKGFSDLLPIDGNCREIDAKEIKANGFDYFITNPPWKREILHDIILNLAAQKPTWLLFDSDWSGTGNAVQFRDWCRKVIFTPRLRWFPDSQHTAKTNSAWYLFDKPISGNITQVVLGHSNKVFINW